MKTLKKLFEKNRAWAEAIKAEHPDFFTQLAQIQRPDYLWIGCADSRVSANQIVNLKPGEVFVHRNIANVVVHTDLNCLSVIQFAVEVLEVKHIIVCGHYGCGGIRAAMESQAHGLIDNWLRHIKDVYRFHKDEIDEIQNEDEKLNLLAEKNVIEQVANVCHTTVVQETWRAGRELSVHGWIYDIGDGILNDLDICVTGLDQLSSTHLIKIT